MFYFFYNLATSIVEGVWSTKTNELILLECRNSLSHILPSAFSIFGNEPIPYTFSNLDYVTLIKLIVSTICCIGVFFIIVKAIKKLFTCFLGD